MITESIDVSKIHIEFKRIRDQVLISFVEHLGCRWSCRLEDLFVVIFVPSTTTLIYPMVQDQITMVFEVCRTVQFSSGKRYDVIHCSAPADAATKRRIFALAADMLLLEEEYREIWSCLSTKSCGTSLRFRV